MTSQHFDDWGSFGDDWEFTASNSTASNNNNNNVNTLQNSQQLSQQNQQYAPQQPVPTSQQPAQLNAPLYSPFSYQQPQQPPIHSTQQPQQHHQPNPFAKNASQPQQQQQSQPQQHYGNPVNFFNPTQQFSDANSINNNNSFGQYAPNQPATYSFVQSPIPTSTITTSLNPQNSQFAAKRDSIGTNPVNPVQYPAPPQSNLPPSSVNYSMDQNAAVPTSAAVPPQQNIYSSNPPSNSMINQSRSVATPPTMIQNYDSNFNTNIMTTQHVPTQFQYPPQQWNDQRSQSNESASNVSSTNWQQQNLFNNNTNQQQQQLSQVPSNNLTEWQNLQAPPVSQSPTVSLSNHSLPSSNVGYFQGHFDPPPKDERSIAQEMPPQVPHLAPPASTNSINSNKTNNDQIYQSQSPKYENLENVQSAQISEPVMFVPQLLPQPSSSPLFNVAPPPKIPSSTNEISYPENRERPDDLSLPPPPPSSQPQISQAVSIPTSSVSSIDRHNYLVTGQLSQEFPPFNTNQQHESFNESLPPPGLSRMVVGEPENNQEQVLQTSQSDLLPPRSNRMVTGNEMTPASFMNYQRQADGEVSHESSSALPPFSTVNQQPPIQQSQQQISQQQLPQHHVAESLQQSSSFNISDRNLYLVAGESDANSQRVITGVESDNNAPLNIINPLQNLHIEDDEDFVNISVTQMSRNIDGDGMEEQFIQQQQIQHSQIQQSLDNSQQREEEIEGANDNNVDLVNNSAQQAVNTIEIPQVPQPLIDQQHSDIREDIEGGNDFSDAPKPPQSVDLEKRRSIDSGMRSQQKQNVTLSSEDSELRELEKNMKSKSRRSKKYDDSNDSESASLDEQKEKSRDKYDERYRSKRDKLRDEYERLRKKEKERRSGGRSRRNDDTDGSRYDSRKRTDDEDDDRRRNRHRNRERRNDEEMDESEKKGTRKDKRRDHGDSRRKDYDYDDGRRERRRRDKYYEGDVYSSGRRSQNTSDYEREYRPGRSSRGAYDMQGYYQQSYPYDTNYYYQQQQYSDKLANWLEQIRMTNPQAYEWYKSYYAGMLQKPQMPPQPPMDDIGGSLRSGYNSGSERASTSRFISGGIVTNPLRSLNSSFIDNTNDYQSLQPSYQAIGKDFNQTYASLNYSNNYDIYGDPRAKQPEVNASRMTPQKFQCLHGFVRLTNGLMITVDTYNTEEKYSVRVENVPIYDKTRRLYQSYPGPLIRGISHKKTVIEFCEDKLKQNSQIEHSLRSSYALLWSYLILMIRQNGSYTEHDIAELLMKNSEEYRSYENDDNKSSSNNINNNNSKEIDDENATDASESVEENVTSEHNSHSGSHQVTQSSTSASILTENVVLDKFKSYLLYGNIHDALDYATDNNLWGHALFLASKVDRRQHANVMLKFANKLSYNDPLQTLYQIMSGRMPACVTNFDDKWGDWRPHLAMIISNCTDKPDLVKRSILALGDTLASRGDIYGSQFCYLLIDPQFTDYSDSIMSSGKIALLGTTVQKSFNEFASNDSIIMTEVYEYARSLSTENYFITTLQNYKFLLATNMLDYGFKLKCLLYMEQISKCIIQQPQLFENSFVSKVYSLADRLKFYDPVMEKLYEDNNINNAEGTEDQKWLQDLSLVLQNQVGSPVSQQYAPPPIPTYSSSNDVYNPLSYQQQSTPIYDPASAHQTPTHVPAISPNQAYEDVDSNQYDNSNNITSYDQQNQVPTYDQNAAYNQYQLQDQQQNNFYGQMQNDGQNVMQNNEQSYLQPSYDQNAQYQQNDYSNSYGWDQPKPTITMGAAVSHKYDKSPTQEKPEAENNQKDDKKSPAKKPETEKSKKQAQGGSWISSIFKFGKASNQMILPDDKNPAIVWDEATKKWVNKDEDPAEAESFKPPPKMGEIPQPQQQQPLQNIPQQQPVPQQQQQQQPQFIPQNQQPMMSQQPLMSQNHVAPMSQMQQQQQPQQLQQNIAEDSAPSVPSAPNMFKMQRGRNLKKSYVDILGNAGKTVSQPKELAPQMDMQFLNPTAQPQGMQFYNPNDFQ